jgi:hypothetical protein
MRRSHDESEVSGEVCFQAGSERYADLQAGDQHRNVHCPPELRLCPIQRGDTGRRSSFSGTCHLRSREISGLRLSIRNETELRGRLIARNHVQHPQQWPQSESVAMLGLISRFDVWARGDELREQQRLGQNNSENLPPQSLRFRKPGSQSRSSRTFSDRNRQRDWGENPQDTAQALVGRNCRPRLRLVRAESRQSPQPSRAIPMPSRTVARQRGSVDRFPERSRELSGDIVFFPTVSWCKLHRDQAGWPWPGIFGEPGASERPQRRSKHGHRTSRDNRQLTAGR